MAPCGFTAEYPMSARYRPFSNILVGSRSSAVIQQLARSQTWRGLGLPSIGFFSRNCLQRGAGQLQDCQP
jgi:hypothetical protein